ncbi:MAG: exonuclease SbcCD subunit D C-terminal domain-containing protein [Desulfobulbaceae bacterium]|nr:exonuclease SbcCD subunit D C-terminal domain-containing protein [Desulfobulbaceae bacterium]
MRILHTSDWHIGRALHGRKRYQEFERFFDWLIECIKEEQIEALLVAGDIFDNGTPSNLSQELYYRFLCRVAEAGCRHVVVTAGNHDSPSLLNAPREVLRYLNVHVIGCVPEAVAEEVVVLRDADGKAQLIIGAVPYLRDRDIRRAEAGETLEDKGRKLLDGIRDHYRQVAEVAVAEAAALGGNVPIVGMGHLFASGGRTVDGDGERELYVGTLGQVRADAFPDCFAYLALGHLHVAQRVMNSDVYRYSGAPLPMSFGEAAQTKVVLAVTVSPTTVMVEEKPVPCFQRLATVRGDWAHIRQRLADLQEEAISIWLEVLYHGDEVIADLQERVRELTAGTLLEVLRIKDLRLAARTLERMSTEETLDDLTVDDVFGRCLAMQQVPLEQQEELIALFRETVTGLHQEDVRNE